MSYRIGLTGNIACGKSTVGRLLAERGADYVDADKLVHALMEAGSPENQAIVDRFGSGVVSPGGQIDRRALGAIVWADRGALRDLERILHPAVRAEIRRLVAESSFPVVAVDAIKLIESGLADEMDAVWAVTCPETEQMRRLVRDRGLSEEQSQQRIAAQPPQAEKVQRADVVIDNGGSLADTERQVSTAWSGVQGVIAARA